MAIYRKYPPIDEYIYWALWWPETEQFYIHLYFIVLYHFTVQEKNTIVRAKRLLGHMLTDHFDVSTFLRLDFVSRLIRIISMELIGFAQNQSMTQCFDNS